MTWNLNCSPLRPLGYYSQNFITLDWLEVCLSLFNWRIGFPPNFCTCVRSYSLTKYGFFFKSKFCNIFIQFYHFPTKKDENKKPNDNMFLFFSISVAWKPLLKTLKISLILLTQTMNTEKGYWNKPTRLATNFSHCLRYEYSYQPGGNWLTESMGSEP